MTGVQQHTSEDVEEASELLSDLAHDLGKYLRMPLGFLPAEASSAQVRDAAQKALRRTRVGPEGTRSAQAIWDDFVTEAPGWLRQMPNYLQLKGQVDRALAWDAVLAKDDGDIDRYAMSKDFDGVGDCIGILLRALDTI